MWHERHGITFKYRRLNNDIIDADYYNNGHARRLKMLMAHSFTVYEATIKQIEPISVAYDIRVENEHGEVYHETQWGQGGELRSIGETEKKIVVLNKANILKDLYSGNDIDYHLRENYAKAGFDLPENVKIMIVGGHCLGNINRIIRSDEETDIVIEAINKYYSTKYEG